MNGNRPARRAADQLILEGIVTSQNEDGSTNISPMGPVVDRELQTLRLRPFPSSTTYQNLKRTHVGIFHVVDDAELLVRAALDQWDQLPALLPCRQCPGHIIGTACRWYAFQVHQLDELGQRVEIDCRTVASGRLRDFLGWNRAMHAVVEAAILATRLHLLPPAEVANELDRLAVIVEKTASDRERAAFDLVRQHVKQAAYE